MIVLEYCEDAVSKSCSQRTSQGMLILNQNVLKFNDLLKQISGLACLLKNTFSVYVKPLRA